MCKTIQWICVLLIAYTLNISPLQAQEKSSTEKMQSTRTESIGSIQKFMVKIAHLNKNIQSKLLRARLTGTHQEFHYDGPWKKDDWYHKDELSTDKEVWQLSCTLYYCEIINEVRRYFRLALIVKIKPNEGMKRWMRIRDEYTQYSEEYINDDYATLNTSGTIRSFTWKQIPHYENYSFQDDPSNWTNVNPDYLYDYELTLELEPFSNSTFTYGKFRGSLENHTKLLERKIAEWVTHFMNNKKKPERLLERN